MSKNSKKKPVESTDDIPEIFGTPEVPDMPDGAIPPADGGYHDPVFTVPKGSSLNCRAGIVGPGKVVTSEMVIGGLATLEHLASVGGLVKE